MAPERAHQSTGGVRAQIVIGIRRQDSAVECRCIGHRVRQPELVSDPINLPDAVPTIRCLAQVEAVEMGQRDDRLCLAVVMLERSEAYGLRLKARIPEQRLPIG